MILIGIEVVVWGFSCNVMMFFGGDVIELFGFFERFCYGVSCFLMVELVWDSIILLYGFCELMKMREFLCERDWEVLCFVVGEV